MKTTSLVSLVLRTANCTATTLLERQSNFTVGQTVQTSSGPVQGHAASNATEVSEYLGIPYALPPVGDLRWAAPQNFTGNTTINGTSFGFSCPANAALPGLNNPAAVASANITAAGVEFLDALAQVGDQFSEDCLTLNIWTRPQTGDANKAVLFWIYGGGFVTGTSNTSGYNGQFIADEEDIVLVTINYRLNMFGFPGSPDTTQNLGLLDQRLAVEWVRDNIAAFGGDPSRITIFGQSAGGAAVDYYTFAWTSDPIVAGFIPESGVATGIPAASAATAANTWFNVSSQLGCGGASSSGDTVLACMRNQSSTDLLAAMAKSAGFGPTVDEVVVFSDYLNRSATGNFIKNPMLLGNTNFEAGLFRAVDAVAGVLLPEAFWDAMTLNMFTCPAAMRANISISNGVPTWRYRYFGVFPDTIIESNPPSGAYHASELLLLFNIPPQGPGIPDQSSDQESIGSYMRGAWAAFAKDPVNGLTNYSGGWPTYSPSQDTLIRLAFQNVTGTNLAPGNMYDMCNTTFAVSSLAGGNATVGGTTPTTSVSSPPATVTKSAAVRNMIVGGYLLPIVFAGAAYLL